MDTKNSIDYLSQQTISTITIQGNIFSLLEGEITDMSLEKKTITLSPEFLDAYQGNKEIAAQFVWTKKISHAMALDDINKEYLFFTLLLKEQLQKPEFLDGLQGINNPSAYSVYLQAYFLAYVAPHCVSFELQELLSTKIYGDATFKETMEFLYREIDGKALFDKRSKTSSDTIYNGNMRDIMETWKESGILDKLAQLEVKRLHDQRNLTQNLNQKKEQTQKDKKIEMTDAPKFSPQYDPKDSIKQNSESKSIQVFGYFDPPRTGYVKQHCMHDFDQSSLKRSVQTNSMQAVLDDGEKSITTYTTNTAPGFQSVPVPAGHTPLRVSSNAILYQNISGDFFAESRGGELVIEYGNLQTEDKFSHTKNLCTLRKSTQISQFLDSIVSLSPAQQLSKIADHIKNKYYDTQYQGSFVSSSSTPEVYFEKMRTAEKMECYSANTLFVALVRMIGIEARLAVGYHSNFVHNHKSYLTANDGHARAEIKGENGWQIYDVTPINQENEDPEEEKKEEEKTETEKDAQKLDSKNLKERLFAQTSDLPFDIKELVSEVGVESAKQYYNLQQKTKQKSDYITHHFQDFLKNKKIEILKHQLHTTKATDKFDLNVLLKEVPGVFTGDIYELNKLSKTKYFLKTKKEEKEKINLPDELRIVFVIDVSGSMDNHQPKTKESLVMMFESFKNLYSIAHREGMEIVFDVYAFGDKYCHHEFSGKDILSVNGDKDTNLAFLKLLQAIPQSLQEKAGGGNAENNFYTHLIQETHRKQIGEKQNKKQIMQVGFVFTDEETLTNEGDFGSTTLPTGEVLPAQTKYKRLESLLKLLNTEYSLPMIAVNVAGGEVKESGYYAKVSCGKHEEEEIITLLEGLLERKIG